jgi:hypothetical protein
MDHNVATTTKLTWELFKLPEPFETIGMNPRMGAETIHNFQVNRTPYVLKTDNGIILHIQHWICTDEGETVKQFLAPKLVNNGSCK